MELSFRGKQLLGLGILALAATLTGIENYFDTEKSSLVEFIFDSLEKSLLLVGAGGVVLLFQNARKQEQQRLSLLQELTVARVEGQAWRKQAQSFLNGFGAEVQKQFVSWGLSDAEAEVGLFMIKGLSHKEIAELRGTAEATVRQHARTVYQKSGLPGKAAFSAYFLEDLLPPAQGNGT